MKCLSQNSVFLSGSLQYFNYTVKIENNTLSFFLNLAFLVMVVI